MHRGASPEVGAWATSVDRSCHELLRLGGARESRITAPVARLVSLGGSTISMALSKIVADGQSGCFLEIALIALLLTLGCFVVV